MASISGITPSSYSQTGDTTGTVASRVPQKILGQQDFLQLLAVQFQVQDPMKPMEDTAFIAQMAQFSALEQSGALARDMTAMRADQQRVAANSYLGHRVTVSDGKAGFSTGEVSAVDVSGTEPQLVVNGNPYSLSAVLRVEPALITAPVPASSQTGD